MTEVRIPRRRSDDGERAQDPLSSRASTAPLSSRASAASRGICTRAQGRDACAREPLLSATTPKVLLLAAADGSLREPFSAALRLRVKRSLQIRTEQGTRSGARGRETSPMHCRNNYKLSNTSPVARGDPQFTPTDRLIM